MTTPTRAQARPTADTRPIPSLPRVIQPIHGDYDDARSAWNLAADQRPAGVVEARSVAEVRAAVTLARRLGLRVAAQGTGHRATALPHLGDALLLKTSLDDELRVDVAARRCRVGAGALWGDVVAATAPHGLVPLAGSSPDVGVVGYTLGGGLSLLGRRHGLAANHVTAIELVVADGSLVRTDATNEPELFWALRGGSAGLGVVTAMEFALHPVEGLYGGTIFWAAEHAREVLRAWAAWSRTAPESITTAARLLRLPPLPQIPEPLRDTPVVAIDGVAVGAPGDGATLVEPLRRIVPAMMDTWGAIPLQDLTAVHGDPDRPTPIVGHGALVADLTDEAVEAFLEAAGPESGSTLVSAELRQLGGAVGRCPDDVGVVGHLDAAFALFAVGIVPAEEARRAATGHVDRLIDAMAPWGTGRDFLNFTDRPGLAERVHGRVTAARLAEIRRAWDPERRFVVSHAMDD
ncbi:MAG: FAD-binding oxidoreductase [Thermoleophilia bacterium]